MTRSKSTLEYWLQTAKPGESFVYHVGHPLTGADGKAVDRHAEKSECAKLAWQLAIAGAGALTQRRIGPEMFQYRVTMGRFEKLDRAFPIRGARVKGDGSIVEAVETAEV